MEWEGPLPGPEDQQQNCTTQNQIIAEYTAAVPPPYPVLDMSTQGGGAAFVPQCAWFTQTASSLYYNPPQLGNFNNQPYSWALVKNPLTVNQSGGYGLDF